MISQAFAPRFRPDGDGIVFTLDMNGSSEIYTMDLNGRARQRLTNQAAIDTSPLLATARRSCSTPTRRFSAALRDVANGSGQRQHLAGEGRYSTPVWSPRGVSSRSRVRAVVASLSA